MERVSHENKELDFFLKKKGGKNITAKFSRRKMIDLVFRENARPKTKQLQRPLTIIKIGANEFLLHTN